VPAAVPAGIGKQDEPLREHLSGRLLAGHYRIERRYDGFRLVALDVFIDDEPLTTITLTSVAD